MSHLSNIDWNLVQFQYEILGATKEELMLEYDLTESYVEYITRNWKPVPAAQRKSLQFTQLDTLEELTDDVASQIRKEAHALTTIKQKHLLPKYLELENILVNRAISLASVLEIERSSVPAISTLTNVLMTLLQNNPLYSNEDGQIGSGEPQEWKVTVVKSENTREALSSVSDEKEI